MKRFRYITSKTNNITEIIWPNSQTSQLKVEYKLEALQELYSQFEKCHEKEKLERVAKEKQEEEARKVARAKKLKRAKE